MAASDILLGLPAGLGAARMRSAHAAVRQAWNVPPMGRNGTYASPDTLHLDLKQHLKLSIKAGQGNISAPLVVSDELTPEIY